jgi:hypothetical protein
MLDQAVPLLSLAYYMLRPSSNRSKPAPQHKAPVTAAVSSSTAGSTTSTSHALGSNSRAAGAVADAVPNAGHTVAAGTSSTGRASGRTATQVDVEAAEGPPSLPLPQCAQHHHASISSRSVQGDGQPVIGQGGGGAGTTHHPSSTTGSAGTVNPHSTSTTSGLGTRRNSGTASFSTGGAGAKQSSSEQVDRRVFSVFSAAAVISSSSFFVEACNNSPATIAYPFGACRDGGPVFDCLMEIWHEIRQRMELCISDDTPYSGTQVAAHQASCLSSVLDQLAAGPDVSKALLEWAADHDHHGSEPLQRLLAEEHKVCWERTYLVTINNSCPSTPAPSFVSTPGLLAVPDNISTYLGFWAVIKVRSSLNGVLGCTGTTHIACTILVHVHYQAPGALCVLAASTWPLDAAQLIDGMPTTC